MKKYSYITWLPKNDSPDPESLLADCASGKYTKQEFLAFIEAGTLSPAFLTEKLDELCGEAMFPDTNLSAEDEATFNLLYDWEEAKDS